MFIERLCRECNNYFIKDIFCGTFEIKNGTITPSDFLQENQFFKINGSVFNDGIYNKNGAIFNKNVNLPKNEIFSGEVWAMAIPTEFIALAEDIKKYESELKKFDDSKAGQYSSESLQGFYSYTKDFSMPEYLKEWKENIKQRKAQWRKL